MPDNNIIVLDLETQKTFDEVGGQNNRAKLKVSFVGLYSYKQGRYYGFWEKDLPNLEKILLKEKPMIVGFNTISFDNVVLQPYFKNLTLSDLPQLDILAATEKELGFRIKLESVAQATLGYGKSGTGLDAINYYRTKQFDKLSRYCLDDVKVTKEVYEYGLHHGQLWYPTGGNLESYPASWHNSPTIPELLVQAFKKHQRLLIQYFELDQNSQRLLTKREIDILDQDRDQLQAFDHLTGKKRYFLIKQILSAVNTQEVFAHQSSLI